MAKGRQLKGRIRSVQNTRKITRTMELVSTSKLKRAQDRVVAARPYAEALRDVLADLVTPELAERFPLLRRPAPLAKGGPRRAALILLTSNRGLAGAFNSNLIKEARRRIETLEGEGYTVELYGDRQEGDRLLQVPRAGSWPLERLDIGDKPTADHAAEIAAAADRRLRGGRAGERGPGAGAVPERAADPAGHDADPAGRGAGRREAGTATRRGRRGTTSWPRARRRSSSELLPLYVRNAVYRGLVETAAAEHGARRTAMKNATDNAGEILEVLKRTYNRQRQAGITQEIAEIVGGAAALQG